ncbi:MAG: flagellar protein FlaG [Colwellia sp.]|nr:flagellar protein FlaG [Colwellia sp.]
MSVAPSGADLGLTNLASELTRSNDISTHNAKISSDKIAEKNQLESIENEKKSVDKIAIKEPLTAEQLEKVAQQLQNFVGDMNRGLEFSVDKDSGRDVIKVIDKSTGDLVKQFPSEEVLTLVAKLSEMVGGFIDAKV